MLIKQVGLEKANGSVLKSDFGGAVVVAQLVEWLLPTPEIRGSNPDICKILSTKHKYNGKDESKEKEAGNGPSLKKERFCRENSQFWLKLSIEFPLRSPSHSLKIFI